METYNFIGVQSFIPCALSVLEENPDILGSHHIKHAVYSKAFDIPFRHKYTGFEYITELDQTYREKFKTLLNKKKIEIKNNINQTVEIDSVQSQLAEQDKHYRSQSNADTTPLDNKEVQATISDKTEAEVTEPVGDIERYRNDLIRMAKRYKTQTPIVYYSGGGDSEVMLQAFLAADVKCYPVCFLFAIDKKHVDPDQLEILYEDLEDIRADLPDEIFEHLSENEVYLNLPEAVNCFISQKRQKFELIVRVIDIMNVWNSAEIKRKLIETHITSPMILTQRVMTSIITEEISRFGDKYLNSKDILRVSV